MCIENTLIDISVESKGLSKAERLSLKLIAKEVKKLKTKIKSLEEALRLFRQDEPTAEEENQKHTKPCPYNKSVPCVQYPDDSCGCDPCEECEIKLRYASARNET